MLFVVPAAAVASTAALHPLRDLLSIQPAHPLSSAQCIFSIVKKKIVDLFSFLLSLQSLV